MDSTDPWSRVAVVAVTHHSAAVIGACLESVRRAAQIIVVDNASDDDTCAIVERVAPNAELIRNAVGVGYGNGANQGLERVRVAFALLANPDSVMTPGAVDWGEDHLLPDVFRALAASEPVRLRNSAATRPWQHVLEPLSGNLMLAEALADEGFGAPSRGSATVMYRAA